MAYIVVKRIAGTVKTENQGALRGIRDPDTVMLVWRGASEAFARFWIEDGFSYSDGSWTEQRGGGHFGG